VTFDLAHDRAPGASAPIVHPATVPQQPRDETPDDDDPASYWRLRRQLVLGERVVSSGVTSLSPQSSERALSLADQRARWLADADIK